jgi:hypothetical protein
LTGTRADRSNIYRLARIEEGRLFRSRARLDPVDTRNATGYTVDLVDHTSPQDFVKLLVEACEVVGRPEIRKMMTRLIGSIPDYPKLIEVYRETYYLPRGQAFGRALERVRAAGLLAKDIDLEALADMIIGAVMYRLIMPSPGDDPAGELRDHMISLLRQAGFDVSRVAR